MKKKSNTTTTICMLVVLGIVLIPTVKSLTVILAVMTGATLCSAWLLKSSRTYVDRNCKQGEKEKSANAPQGKAN